MTTPSRLIKGQTRQRVARGVEDDAPFDAPEINVTMGTVTTKVVPGDGDLFALAPSNIKGLDGVSARVKKSATRMEKRFEGEGDAASKQGIEKYGSGYLLFDVIMPPYNLKSLATLFEESSPHGAAVRAKTSNIVALGYDFVESPATREKVDQATGNADKIAKLRRKLERMKVEMNNWLDTRNKEDTFTETLIKVWTDYETTGNGYIEVGRKSNGEIGYIGHIPAVSIRVRRMRDGYVQLLDDRAMFFRNFGDRTTADVVGSDPQPNEIIHLKKYTPNNGYYGVPEIVSAMPAVLGNRYSSDFNLDYFENKAVPRYVVVLKGASLGLQNEKKVAEFFEGGLKGKNHRTLVVPLPPDTQEVKTSFEMKPVEAGKVDSSFNAYKKENLNEILMAHRVPISKIGLAEGVSLAVARDADKTFKEQVCRPEQKILEKKLNRIIQEVTDVFLLKMNELTLTDEDTLSKMDERYLRMKVMLPNEVRARWGWAGIEGGDEPVELKPQQAADQAATAGQTRTRDAERSANASDSDGEGRNAQGEGRRQE